MYCISRFSRDVLHVRLCGHISMTCKDVCLCYVAITSWLKTRQKKGLSPMSLQRHMTVQSTVHQSACQNLESTLACWKMCCLPAQISRSVLQAGTNLRKRNVSAGESFARSCTNAPRFALLWPPTRESESSFPFANLRLKNRSMIPDWGPSQTKRWKKRTKHNN